jgi:hypothetical protein
VCCWEEGRKRGVERERGESHQPWVNIKNEGVNKKDGFENHT